QRYGDNIYHRSPATGEWIQEDSFHSQENGIIDPDNLAVDTGTTDHVLISDWYIYCGGDGPDIPSELSYAVQKTQGHKSITDKSQIDAIVRWAKSIAAEGTSGDPYEWRRLTRRVA